MRSPADRFRMLRVVPRAVVERVLRLAAIAALVWLVVRAFAPAARTVTRPVQVRDLPWTLPAWTATSVATIQVTAERLPSAEERAWLRALRRAGTPVTWAPAPGVGALAASVEPLPSPHGGERVTIAADSAALALRDALGMIDTVAIGADGGAALAVDIDGTLVVEDASSAATARAREALTLRPVFVSGSAVWETKFVAAALEEAGWSVHAAMTVAPGVVVTQGIRLPLDTAYYSAIVVVDSTGVRPSEIRRFVERGGGVVLAPGALTRAEYAALGSVTPGVKLGAELGALTGPMPRRGLVANELRTGAVALERRDGRVVLVGRRVGAGRVIVTGYEETWRWRMQGADGAVAAHRAWWSGLVERVAYAGVHHIRAKGGLDEAPYAATVAALAAPIPFRENGSNAPAVPLDALLFSVVMVSLLGEWASRRLRGAT